MLHPLIKSTCAVWRHWTARPYWSACLFLMIAALILNGPLACVVHCLIADAAHHEVPHMMHMQHETMPMGDGHPAPICDGEMQHHPADAPSPLTVAIVLTLLLLPCLRAVAFRPASPQLRLASFAIPPPHDPPRSPLA